MGFRNALERYPDLELSTMQISLPACDACRLGGRVSTILGRLGGLAYNRLSFEVRDIGYGTMDLLLNMAAAVV